MKDSREKFVSHGYYTVSNTIGYSVQISEDGCSARLKVNDKVTEWYEIEFLLNEDQELEGVEAIIDRNGYNVPLEQVMRLDTPVSYAMNTCCICNGSYVGFGNNAEPIMDGECCNKCNYEEVIPARLSTFPLT